MKFSFLFFASLFTFYAQTSVAIMGFALTIGLILLLTALYYYFKNYCSTTANDAKQPRRLRPQWLFGTLKISAYDDML
jgi:hypothetical protein